MVQPVQSCQNFPCTYASVWLRDNFMYCHQFMILKTETILTKQLNSRPMKIRICSCLNLKMLLLNINAKYSQIIRKMKNCLCVVSIFDQDIYLMVKVQQEKTAPRRAVRSDKIDLKHVIRSNGLIWKVSLWPWMDQETAECMTQNNCSSQYYSPANQYWKKLRKGSRGDKKLCIGESKAYKSVYRSTVAELS